MRTIKTDRCLLAIALYCLLVERTAASYCYPDYCQNSTDLVQTPDFQCLLTQVQKGKDCTKLEFKDTIVRFSKSERTAIFTLRAYVFKFNDSEEKATAFNLSVTDIDFRSLVTRYQNTVDENANACRYVKLYDDSSHLAPKDLYVSCPFSRAGYEGSPYHLEYLVIDGIYSYSKKYIFYVPQHRYIEDGIQVKTFTPFIYVDVSDSSNLVLYVQPLPPRYNVTKYRAWLIRNDTEWAMNTIIYADDSQDRGNNIRYNFTLPDGVYYIKVAALHPECGEYGCANSTSPYIDPKNMFNHLLIMIISTAWIPFALFFLFIYISDLYRKRALKCIVARPNCLLIYSATNLQHVNVMRQLAIYLQSCNINVMIDILHIQDIVTKDPQDWCIQVFEKADVVLIVSSPPCAPAPPDVIAYQKIDRLLLRLVLDHHSRMKKRYYAVHLPYSDMESPLPGKCYNNEFFLPKDMRKLVRAIHSIGYIRLYWPSDKMLLDSINCVMETSDNEISNKNTEEIYDLSGLLDLSNEPPSIMVQKTANQNVSPTRSEHRSDTEVHTFETPVIKEWYMTDINELDLLGENRERVSLNHARGFEKDHGFHIDKLDL